METLASQCAEEPNSTDCLLRTLIKFLEDIKKEDDDEFNWDPITFGFTVSIAIIAAGFALITIIQAILTASPGRRKSDFKAIGKWSKHTERRWEFRDLGYLHVAKTPILTVQNVIENFPTTSQQPSPAGEEPTRQYSAKFAATAARWLTFLDDIGLSALDFKNEALEVWLADYLPTDLLSVPALIEMQLVFIYLCSSNKPFRVLDIEKRYPSIVGTDFQFETRPHPTFGSVGAFSKYHSNSSHSQLRSLSQDELRVAVEQAQGIIPIAPIVPEESRHDSLETTRKRNRDRRRLGMSGVMEEVLITRTYPLLFAATEGHRESCGRHHLHNWRALLHNSHILFAFIFTRTPDLAPGAFPWSRLDTTGIMEALSISGNIALGGKLKPNPELQQDNQRPHILGMILGSCDTHCNTELLLSSESLPCMCHRVMDACCEALFRFGTFAEWIAALPWNELPQLRGRIMDILSILDIWLEARCDHLLCVKFDLFNDTMGFQKTAQGLRNLRLQNSDISIRQFLEVHEEYEKNKDSETWDYTNFTKEECSQILTAVARSITPSPDISNLQNHIPSKFRTSLRSWEEESSFSEPMTGRELSWPLEGDYEKTEVELFIAVFRAERPKKDLSLVQQQQTKVSREQLRNGHITKAEDNLVARVLSWRMLLIMVLYMTAFENTPMLASGTWNQVIPML